MASIHKKPNSPYWMMKFRAEDGRVVMRSTKTTDRTTAMLMAIESEAAAKKARAGELTQAVILKTLGEMMEKDDISISFGGFTVRSSHSLFERGHTLLNRCGDLCINAISESISFGNKQISF